MSEKQTEAAEPEIEDLRAVIESVKMLSARVDDNTLEDLRDAYGAHLRGEPHRTWESIVRERERRDA